SRFPKLKSVDLRRVSRRRKGSRGSFAFLIRCATPRESMISPTARKATLVSTVLKASDDAGREDVPRHPKDKTIAELRNRKPRVLVILSLLCGLCAFAPLRAPSLINWKPNIMCAKLRGERVSLSTGSKTIPGIYDNL